MPEPKFMHDMGKASILAGVVLLVLAQLERWRRAR